MRWREIEKNRRRERDRERERERGRRRRIAVKDREIGHTYGKRIESWLLIQVVVKKKNKIVYVVDQDAAVHVFK